MSTDQREKEVPEDMKALARKFQNLLVIGVNVGEGDDGSIVVQNFINGDPLLAASSVAIGLDEDDNDHQAEMLATLFEFMSKMLRDPDLARMYGNAFFEVEKGEKDDPQERTLMNLILKATSQERKAQDPFRRFREMIAGQMERVREAIGEDGERG